jgi:hypothetical protein
VCQPDDLLKPGLTSDMIGLACLGALVVLNMKFQPRSLARTAQRGYKY